MSFLVNLFATQKPLKPYRALPAGSNLHHAANQSPYHMPQKPVGANCVDKQIIFCYTPAALGNGTLCCELLIRLRNTEVYEFHVLFHLRCHIMQQVFIKRIPVTPGATSQERA